MNAFKSLKALFCCTLLVVLLAHLPAAAGDHGDTCSEATVVSPNSVTGGEIETAGDWDYFKFTVATNGVLTAYTTGRTDTYGYLLDSECNIILEDDDGGQNRNFDFQANITAGVYHVAVRHYYTTATGAYTLNIQFQPDDHGNSCQEATTLACNSSAAGLIYPAGDWDYFKVVLDSPGILTVNTTGSTDTYGYLLDAECGQIAFDNDSGQSKNFRMEETLPAGTYHVAVLHYNTSRTGAYTLEAACSLYHTITASAGSGGTISPSGSIYVSSGGSQAFTITPNYGNTVEDVLVDGVSVGPVTSYLFSNVNADHVIYATFNVPPGSCTDISDVPLDARRHGAPANIMFVLDDSGSMDWEVMTPEVDGLFDDYSYVFDDPGDHVYKTGVYSRILTGADRMLWKSQWPGYNKIYYDPAMAYDPWPTYGDADTAAPRSHPASAIPTFDLSGTYATLEQAVIIDEMDAEFTKTGSWQAASNSQAYDNYYYWTPYNGDYTAAWTPGSRLPAGQYDVYARWFSNDYRSQSVPYKVHHAEGETVVTVNQRQNGGTWYLLGTFQFAADTGGVSITYTRTSDWGRVCADAIKFVPTGESSIDIINAHYYTWSFEEQRPYLVVLDGAVKYYRVDDVNYNGRVEFGEIILTGDPPDDVQISRSYAEERQNFANWYSFYRRRELAATAAMANFVVDMQGVQVGIRSINANLVQPVLKVKVGGVDETAQLLEAIYNYGIVLKQAATPLRAGLQDVGRYFDKNDDDKSWGDGGVGPSPIATADEGGECQQNFAIVFTDGHWNGGAPGVDNVDGDQGPPYADGYPNTLADVAMYYYLTDLAPELQNLVPINPYDNATHQHMATYSVTFGVYGSLNPGDYDLINGPFPEWPNPNENFEYKIDDMWHAAVNGRGRFLSASNTEELLNAFVAVRQDIESRIGSASSVSINGDELYGEVGEGVMVFQSTYYSDGWSGDVKAYEVNPVSGAVNTSSYVWSASERLENMDWDTDRIIATYDGGGAGGQPFRFDHLTAVQKGQLDPGWETDDSAARDILDYLRGDTSNDYIHGGSLRTRFRTLGDIVHSSPLFVNDILYAGSNDGMLHAFNPQTGDELFAFVPNLIFQNLADLAGLSYTHRFYVDLTPTARDGVTLGGVGGKTLLVGGLGKGGKGFYALDVTDPYSILTEYDLAARVLWEYPNAGTGADELDNMGFTYSRPQIVDSHAGWVVIAGNGYNSQNSRAVLLVIDPSTGALLRSIDTGVASCNGLSTPIAVDVDYDRKVDYVYAGDLRGNLWKFDLTSGSYADWDVAFKEGVTPKPLFQAKGPAGQVQPITTRPDVMFHCRRHGYMVLFGTGRYLGETDFWESDVHTIYGIWDYGDDADESEFLGSFERGAEQNLSNQPATVSLLQQTQIDWRLVEGNYLRTLSQNTPVWATDEDLDSGGRPNPSAEVANHAGWYFDLPLSSERVVIDLLIRDGKAIVLSFKPEASPCGTGGESVIHEIDACSGGRLSQPQFDVNDDGNIDELDMVNVGTEEEPIWVAPSGIKRPGRLQTPAILRLDNEREVKYFSSSTGTIETLRERAIRLGLGYWIEVAR